MRRRMRSNVTATCTSNNRMRSRSLLMFTALLLLAPRRSSGNLHPFLTTRTAAGPQRFLRLPFVSKRHVGALSKRAVVQANAASSAVREDDAATNTLLSKLRGGSTTTATPPSSSSTSSSLDELQSYRLQQQLHLQSRSLQLRQALIARGLDGLQHGDTDAASAAPKKVDWDCALSTARHPKSCLYSFDAEEGAKVIAPIDTQQWITLSALNRLRRTDPTKVEPLWHSQFAILKGWMHPDSDYSLYMHLTPAGTLLSFLLDAPAILASVMMVTVVVFILVTLPLWEGLLQHVLTSQYFWMHWPDWARFVHAAFPLKLLLGQMAWKAMAVAFSKVYHRIRNQLVDLECQMWQDSIPLTIIDDDDDDDDDENEERIIEEVWNAEENGDDAEDDDDENMMDLDVDED